MSALAHEAGVVSGKTSVMMVTIGLHAVLIAGLMTTRMIAQPDPGPAPIKSWLDPEKPPLVSSANDEPTRNHEWTPSRTPLPKLPGEIEETQTLEAIPAQPGPQGPDYFGPADPGPAVIPSTPSTYRATRPTDEFYPAAAIRSNEYGAAVVQVCISAQGELAERPRISTSSGYSRLDGAAIRWAMEGARFIPATRNGEPVAECRSLRVNFTLKGN
ncbi:MAG: siderophore-mediated iron transport protein [Pseudomonadota bacterium]|jgi:TonB family protein